MKKLLYLSMIVIGSCLFNSCSKSDGQEVSDPQGIDDSDKLLGSYVIVHATSTTALSSAVNSKLASSSTYKLAGGPFMYHVGGTETYGQALYK